ncbi:hypothetical protein [Stygiolobus caldivivus]|uniref:FUN14 family protein n=1 Tax=Stygiolobus caldivivus TaxID=2824673 RepID=A0A8D5U908_9CREN|nr:hypothetical protein [Stygiolobus caldivivus]BCU70956.1 hypothetical protein KN1_22530 [Stygiolobus caldivivus]
MITIPDIPKSEIVYAIVTFLLGLLIGYLVKNIVKIGVVILAIIILLVVAGVISPHTILSFVQSTASTAIPEAEKYANEAITYIPYNSLIFIIGFVLGLIKG